MDDPAWLLRLERASKDGSDYHCSGFVAGQMADWIRKQTRQRPVAFKHWGLVLDRHHTGGTRVETAWIAAGGKSSLHCHGRWANTFVLVSGRICVQCYSTKQNRLISDEMYPGESLTIGPLHQHRFVADVDSVIVEVYTPTNGVPIGPDDIDIERFTPPHVIDRITLTDDTWTDNLTGETWKIA